MSPVPEPLAVTLRRLHEEATGVGVSRHDPDVYGILRDSDVARATLRNALPAIADLVASVEECCSRNCRQARTWMGATFSACNCTHCRSLAALREQLGARP